MIGRLLGVVVGAAIFALGYGMWKPATFAKYYDLSHVPLGPFAAYSTIVYYMIMILGVVVALASIQRKGRQRAQRPPVTMFADDPVETHAPAHAHDDHFKIDDDHAAPAHDDHAPAHDDHGHHAPAHH